MPALELVRDRTVQRQADARVERDCAYHGLQSLRGRVAAERQCTHVFGTCMLAAGKLVHVDAVAERDELRRCERKRASVDADHARDDPLCHAKRSSRIPVRVPEEQRDAQRAHEGRGEQRVQRNHVRDHRERTRTQRRGEHRLEARAA